MSCWDTFYVSTCFPIPTKNAWLCFLKRGHIDTSLSPFHTLWPTVYDGKYILLSSSSSLLFSFSRGLYHPQVVKITSFTDLLEEQEGVFSIGLPEGPRRGDLTFQTLTLVRRIETRVKCWKEKSELYIGASLDVFGKRELEFYLRCRKGKSGISGKFK